MRKSNYLLNRKLKSEDTEAAPLAFGSAIHKGLEHWYSIDKKDRVLPKSLREETLLYANGYGLDRLADHPAQEALRQFVLAKYDSLRSLPDSDKRSLNNGLSTLIRYFEHYANDGLRIVKDESGPIIERDVEFTLYESALLKINYFGTIDAVLENPDTGIILVTDHKTTSALGKEFYARCNPNPQYTGYVMAAQRTLGLKTNLFCINGIQVAKTKHEFSRQITERTESDFNELRMAVISAVGQWIEAGYTLVYPMSGAPNACGSYGGCMYLDVCSAPEKLRENIISSKWPKTN